MNYPEEESPFTTKDLQDLLRSMDLSPELDYDSQVENMLLEMAKTFLTELLENNVITKKELTLEDVKAAIALKFPEVADRRQTRSIDILQKRNSQIDDMNSKTNN